MIHHTRAVSAALLAFLLTLMACSPSENAGKPEPTDTATQSQVQFAAYDTDGGLRQSSEWIGKGPVVLNFWGTWCPPCRKEIPDLVRLANEFKPMGVQLISLAVNDSPSDAANFAYDNNMVWPQLVADKQLLINLRATSGVPTTIFIDANGYEVGRFVGLRDYDTFKAAFQALAPASAS